MNNCGYIQRNFVVLSSNFQHICVENIQLGLVDLTTVRMNEMPRFYVAKLLLHHYKRDLAHISDFDSLVIGLSKSER